MKTLPQLQQDYLTGAPGLVVPEVILVGVACVMFLLAAFAPRRLPCLGLAVFGLIGAASAAVDFGPREIADFWALADGTPFSPRSVAPIDPTGLAGFIRWIAIAGAAAFLFIGWSEVTDETAGEYFGCLFVVAAGVSLVGRANDAVSLFLALEMISIPTYILLYLPAHSRAGQEATVKYFLLSILSSGMLLFGFSYLYGMTGSTNLGAMGNTLTAAHLSSVNPLAIFGMVLVIAGIGFRVTAVPFHFYAPDVYEGGPTGVVAQLAYVPKVAGFIALARVLGLLDPPTDQLPFDAIHTLIPLTLWVIAAVTMTVGNVMALLQDNLKRMLAYSGIAHAGYLFIGILVGLARPDVHGAGSAQTGMAAVLVYLVAYGLMTVGAFALLAYLSGPKKSAERIDDLAGVGQSRPLAGGAMAVLLFSLIGLPPTAGFAGKFLLFLGAFEAPTAAPMGHMYQILAVIAAVNAAIGAIYYLRVIGTMYLQPAPDAVRPSHSSLALLIGVICAVATIAIGIYPQPLLDAARHAAPVKDDRPLATPVGDVAK